MPRPVLPWASRPSLWALPVSLVLVGTFVLSTFDPTRFAGYWEATLSSSGIFIILSAPICAAVAAIEGSRIRRGSKAQITPVRPGLSIYWQRLWPSLALGGVIQIVAFLLAARNTWGAPGAPNPWIFIAFMAVVAAHSGMGLLIGRLAPLPIGLPLVFLLSYTWLGFAWAVPYFPLRYMAGLSLSDCCRIQYAMDYRAVATTILFNTCCFIVFLICVTMIGMQFSKRDVLRRAIPSLVLTTIAIIASVVIAAPLGPYPAIARPPSDVMCEGIQPIVCLYPEQENNPTLRATIPAALEALSATGAIVPPVVEASAEATNPDRLRIGIGLRGTPAVVIQSLANAFLQPSGYAYCSDEQALLDRQNASMTIVSWLIHKMAVPDTGVSPQDVGGSEDLTGSVTKILAMPEKDQGKWFNATLPALMDCSASIELP